VIRLNAKRHLITEADSRGAAHKSGVRAGDELTAINGKPIADFLDYRYLAADGRVTLSLTRDGAALDIPVVKREYEDLGLSFELPMMDRERACRNRCMFCFIDQLPRGMRPTLYFKDDDFRLSFLHGNYVTLTNMTESDLERVAFYHLSPVNISAHATDTALRRVLLGNPSAPDIMPAIRRLAGAGLTMNFQIVLLPGLNDGAALDESIDALSAFIPRANSLSVVPVGLTRHRAERGLPPLKPFSPESAAKVIALTDRWRARILREKGAAFVYAADEFYLKAGIPIPPYEYYGDFPQIENGVGMTAAFESEFAAEEDCLTNFADSGKIQMSPGITSNVGQDGAVFGVATGMAAYPSIRRLVRGRARVYAVPNRFFGEMITVSGLLTGRDIAARLSGERLGGRILIPQNALRSGTDIFLDDMTVGELSARLGVSVTPVPADGAAFARALTLISG
jgi:putative radical SAM enzyme (TIGR03279 family)